MSATDIPDKVCDFISDAILDYCLSKDKGSRVAVETMAKDYNIVLGGEVTSDAELTDDVLYKIVTNVLQDIGYDYTPNIINLLNKQSPDIALGTNDEVGGAGDQGIMFGYACNDNSEFLPMAYVLARRIIREIESDKSVNNLGPDMKSQVTLEDHDVKKVLVSVQHPENYSLSKVKSLVVPIIKSVLDSYNLNYNERDFLINPTGRFVIGGPVGDAGVTGRKIIVDTYGGAGHHGGGAFSGKDPSKVDRSAAYMLRKIAKNVVSSGICSYCEIQISYAIGKAEPLSIVVDTDCFHDFNDGLAHIISDYFDLTPKGIRDSLDLLNVNYKAIGMTNIFGNSSIPFNKPWEEIDRNFVDIVRNAFIDDLISSYKG